MNRYAKQLFVVVVLAIALASCGKSADGKSETVTKLEYSTAPEGYKLVWADEFDAPEPMPNTDHWWYETGGGGWGNHELQTYVAGVVGSDTLATVKDGVMTIKAIKLDQPLDDCNYASIRINTKESWQYGYFEARLKLPKGYGTWPAFWMLPKDFKDWPLDGEIDIMEHAGNNPDSIHITVHTLKHNHSNGTQISSVSHADKVQDEFHVYGLEWTKDFIKGYIDGELKYTFNNTQPDDVGVWPFDKPFYLKLNLALGGFFSDQLTVDDDVLPATYEIDYVRVFQK